MNQIIYLVGLIVIAIFILGFFGLRWRPENFYFFL